MSAPMPAAPDEVGEGGQGVVRLSLAAKVQLGAGGGGGHGAIHAGIVRHVVG